MSANQAINQAPTDEQIASTRSSHWASPFQSAQRARRTAGATGQRMQLSSSRWGNLEDYWIL